MIIRRYLIAQRNQRGSEKLAVRDGRNKRIINIKFKSGPHFTSSLLPLIIILVDMGIFFTYITVPNPLLFIF